MAEKIEPLRLQNLGFAQHSFQSFNAEVPVGTTKEDLENPHFWDHCKHKLRLHDEIRAIAEDSSFMALVLVTFNDGMNVLTKVIWGCDLEPADPEMLSKEQDRYYIKMRGKLAWCVVDRETDRNIREGIKSKSDAMRELEDHLRALAA